MYPPYSPKAKKNANTLRFKPPGFVYPIYVPFTGRRLAVCERCKKNFKTRDHCRTRDCHVDLPWSETFVCVSLDPSCTDENGKLLDGPFFARAVSPIAFNYSGEIDRQTPICAPCKDKNYTRTYCRHQKRHLQLPWSTVYVILTLTPGTMRFGGDYIKITSPTNSSQNKKSNDSESIITLKKSEEDDHKDEDKGKDDKSETTGEKDIIKKEEREAHGGTDSLKEKNDSTCNENEKNDSTCNETAKKDDAENKDEAEKVSQTNNVEKDNKSTKRKKAIIEEDEAKKMEDIPRSRTLLATVSCEGCTIEVSRFSCVSRYSCFDQYIFVFHLNSVIPFQTLINIFLFIVARIRSSFAVAVSSFEVLFLNELRK